jgi:hypothetical protein
MRKALGSRLTYANVMATVAVFLALGGGAYALSGVPDRSGVYHGCVATSGALRVVAKASSCRKAKTVRRRTRRVRIPGESAIAWNQQGRAGQNGANGLSGANGATNAVIRFASFTSNTSGQSSHVHVQCNTGERAVGGGIGWTQSPGSGDGVLYSGPEDANFGSTTFPAQGATPTGWAGEIKTSDGAGKTGRVYAICASP